MVAVVDVQFVTVPTGRWQSIDHDQRYGPFPTGRSLVHSTNTSAGLGIRDSFLVFFTYKKVARPNRDANS